MDDNILTSLAQARWQTASRTYGNSHATLIGLLVDWWVSGTPEHRWVLEGGPSFGYRPQAQKGNGQCDAVLGEGAVNKGIIEVEGTRHTWTIEKIGKFFAAEYPEFSSLTFAIFLAYAYGPAGKGKARTIPPLPLDEYVAQAKDVTAHHPGKSVVVLALDKAWEPQVKGSPRARSEYYWGRPSRLTGAYVVGGSEMERRVLMEWTG